MDFEFRTFSPRSFERFSQALALHTLGDGVLVFGDGPDGGREASYEGTLNFPTEADKWSGYTIMQAKFLQVPGTPGEDAKWLVESLREELLKFVPPTSLRAPDYYILVTNATLSPLPEGRRGKGGLAKVDEVFSQFKEKIGFKDYRVWHKDQISVMLASAPDLRRSYAAWLSSSDVIAELLESVQGRSRDIKDGMYRYLMRELKAHQPLRLQQAGHSGDAQTMIEDVFTDLPFRDPAAQKKENSAGLLRFLLNRSRDKLDEPSVSHQIRRKRARPGRILLLGGPGQGKSTLSQYMAQVARAAILKSERSEQYPAEVARVIESTLSKAVAGGLDVSIPRRFPLRVELPNFADSLSDLKEGASSLLLSHMSHHVTTVAGTLITNDDLRRWISNYPVLMILDGLDEVPPSANRDAVIRAINEFWDEAPSADIMMVVTTRPQGYNDDLDPDLYSKFEMTPLKPEQALVYASKLAEVRITEPVQRDRVLQRLTAASLNKTTARLMISPLQVAILLALVDQRGDAPTDRWSLFDKYFSVVLEREQGKAGPVGETMRHWGRQIASLHHKVGFLLQMEAENQGSSEAYLSTDELAALIRGQLLDEEFEGEELDKITEELRAASTERLVLIVQREDDRFSFEVRSLQEFMAAAYLMTGREATVQARLREIANRAHWLHVFQIAASKCFSVTDSEQYRDTIIATCQDINENGDEVDRLLRTGSSLASALLDDGLAYDQPKYRRLLLRLALDILAAGPAMLSESLADHCEREPVRMVEHMHHYLASTTDEQVDAAWKLLMICANNEQAWSVRMLRDIQLRNGTIGARIFSLGVIPNERSELRVIVRQVMEECRPADIYRQMGKERNGRRLVEAYSKVFPCLGLFEALQVDTADVWVGGRQTQLSLRFVPLEYSPAKCVAFDDLPDAPAWQAFQYLRGFYEEIGTEKLLALLSEAASADNKDLFEVLRWTFPWPASTMLSLGAFSGDLGSIMQRLEAGQFGEGTGWLRAEERWRSEGILDSDLLYWATGDFFGDDVGERGAPWAMIQLTHSDRRTVGWADSLIRIGIGLSGAVRWQLKHIVRFVLTHYKTSRAIGVDEALFLFETEEDPQGYKRVYPENLECIPARVWRSPAFLSRLNEVGLAGDSYATHSAFSDQTVFARIGKEVGRYPGVLVLLAPLLTTGRWHDPTEVVDAECLRDLSRHGNIIVAGCAAILLLSSGRIEGGFVRQVLSTGDVDRGGIVIFLLEQLLGQEGLPKEVGRHIAECIAFELNRDVTFPRRQLMQQIRTHADTRSSGLHGAECWQRLDLGDRLFAHTMRR